jgi:hypothetical protein
MPVKIINLVAADMGYGHQRAAYPLLDLAGGEIVSINNYPGIPEWEKEYWRKSLNSYEQFSRFKKLPLVGNLVFEVMDAFQKIAPLYPFRDLSRPTIQQRYFYSVIKKGLGRPLIEKLSQEARPFVTTFFVDAYIAEYYNYPGDIYCIVCDTDASRAWAPLRPADSRVKFLVPSKKVRERFVMYGVKPDNIIISGFPLPKENVGSKKEILKKDLARRIAALDPEGTYRDDYESLLEDYLPKTPIKSTAPLTLSFAVGGAGAQKEMGTVILNRLAGQVRRGKIVLNLIAGNRAEVKDYFSLEISRAGLEEGKGVNIIFASDKMEYFRQFNDCLHGTDVLWTKPSELSFYCALGLPIIMSTPVGSQEDFNREWLISVGAGIDSLDPRFVDEWLPDMLASGRLARAAMDGFLNAEAMGTYNIAEVIGQTEIK